MGVIEEVGELAHSQLKKEQGIRGTPEEHDEALKDAVADITIFFSDFCTAAGWQMDEVLRIETFSGMQFNSPSTAWASEPWRLVLRMSKFVGKLAAAHDEEDPNAAKAASYLLFSHVAKFCAVHHWDMQAIVEKVWWQEVKPRDFQKYPRTGLPPKPKPFSFVPEKNGLYMVRLTADGGEVKYLGEGDDSIVRLAEAYNRGMSTPQRLVPRRAAMPVPVQEPKRPDEIVAPQPAHPDRTKAEYKERFDRYPLQDEARAPDPLEGKQYEQFPFDTPKVDKDVFTGVDVGASAQASLRKPGGGDGG